jgi:dUTP pyrophosphatase
MPQDSIRVEITRLPHAPADLPAYATEHAAGMDLRLAGNDLTIEPGERALLPTGFCIAVPPGYEGQVRMRSGTALLSGLLLPNAPGTIDSDYRGELKILVMNVSRQPVQLASGERIAQLIISPVAHCLWVETAQLELSRRGPDGFGSTGRQ